MVLGSNFIFVHVPKTGGTSISQALGGRSPGHVYSLHCPLSAMRVRNRRAFGFVRNPWDWKVSIYAYKTADDDPERFRHWLFNESMMLKDDFKRRKIAPMQRRSQMYWLDGCYRIGRFERLAQDFEAICDRIGIARDPLPHLNGSDPRDYRGFYDGKAVDFVTRHSAAEIDLFGYRFEDGPCSMS